MSSSSLDYITTSAKSVFGTVVPESTSRQKRIQELIIEIEDMEQSLSVVDFGDYFERLKEVKDILLGELVSVYTDLRKKDLEVERLTIIVHEKNKAVTTLADENVAEKEELRNTKQKMKDYEHRLEELEKREKEYESVIRKLRKNDSAKEEDDSPFGFNKI
eukprot:g8519.t1